MASAGMGINGSTVESVYIQWLRCIKGSHLLVIYSRLVQAPCGKTPYINTSFKVATTSSIKATDH